MKKIDIVETLRIADLPKEDQQRIERSVEQLLKRSIVIRVMKELGLEKGVEFMEEARKAGMEKFDDVAATKIPKYEEMVRSEIGIVLGRLRTVSAVPYIGG